MECESHLCHLQIKVAHYRSPTKSPSSLLFMEENGWFWIGYFPFSGLAFLYAVLFYFILFFFLEKKVVVTDLLLFLIIRPFSQVKREFYISEPK